MLEFDDKNDYGGTNIKIIGVGGAGGNALNAMIANDLEYVEFIAANTDNGDLAKSNAKMKIQLGRKLTHGLGTGADPDLGSRSAEESKDDIKAHLQGAHMLIITAGMGGGTGTGAAPIIAKIAREMGILTLAIVSTPFAFEGAKREQNAATGIKHLNEYVDSLIIVPNEKLSQIYGEMLFLEAFDTANQVLYQAAKAISDIITYTGYINVDFADVKAVMQNSGYALMGTGMAEGEDRAIVAARNAISNPLLSDINLAGCKAILLNITMGTDARMNEVEDAGAVISNEAGNGTSFFQGVIIDDEMTGKFSVTVIATGLNAGAKKGDYPSFEMPNTSAVEPETSDDMDLEAPDDIIKKLGLFKPEKEEKQSDTSHEETNRIKNLRTDVPSFLKALD